MNDIHCFHIIPKCALLIVKVELGISYIDGAAGRHKHEMGNINQASSQHDRREIRQVNMF